jgi:hypothetical protein
LLFLLKPRGDALTFKMFLLWLLALTFEWSNSF